MDFAANTAAALGVVAAEQQMVGLRGIVTVLATLGFVGVCFAAVELLERRSDRAAGNAAGSTSRATAMVTQQPVDDVWPLRGTHRRSPERRVLGGDRVLVASLAGSFVAVGLALSLIPLRSAIGLSSIALALVLVIVIVGAAAGGGRVAAAVTSAVAALSFNFLHTVPLYTFHIAATRNIVTSVLMILIGIAVGEVAARRVPTNHHNTPTEELP